MINLFEPQFGQAELNQVANSMRYHWVGKGRKVDEFEAAWAWHIGVSPEQVVSVSCATEGLFQILELLQDFDYRDEFIIPSIHFVGAANAVLSSRLDAVFCDVNKYTLSPTLEHIQADFTRYTRGVILLHYGGMAQELDTIRQWCDDKGLWLIEDAACSLATVYKGKAAGTWGHFGVWSFDAMKILSCGDGGMIYCENPEHAKELRQRLYLGMNNASGLKSSEDRWWEFEVSYPGRRAVMNDIAAGIGLEQLKKLDGFIERRIFLANFYNGFLNPEWCYHPDRDLINDSYYFYWIQTPRRDELARFLRANDIYTTFRYYPLHRVFKTGQSLPGAEYAADNTLLLPLHCGLSDDDVNYICEKVREFFK